MKKESDQNHNSVDLPRRDALRRIALLPIYALSLDAVGSTPQWTPEEVLPHCAAGITACDQLSKGQGEDMSLAFSVLTTYLTPLKEIVEQSSQHRKEAARLVAQALCIKALLSLHREGPKRALSYAKQAEIYSRESGDITLQLVSLGHLAWIYACDKQDQQALDMALKARSLLLKQQKKGIAVHSLIQSDT